MNLFSTEVMEEEEQEEEEEEKKSHKTEENQRYNEALFQLAFFQIVTYLLFILL